MRTQYVLAIVLAALVTVAYFWLQTSQELLVPVTDWLFPSASGILSILAFLVVHKWGFRGKFGIVHLGLFAGFFMYFLGDTIWAIYETILQIEIPYPSPADAIYLASYIPIAIGIVQFLWSFRSGIKRQRSFAALAVGLLFVALICAFLIGPLVVSAEDSLTKTFDVAYPVLDSMLVVLALFMFILFRGGKMAGSWLWISLGLLLSALADIMFSMGTLQGWYYSGHPIELIYLWGSIGLGLGFVEQRGDQLV